MARFLINVAFGFPAFRCVENRQITTQNKVLTVQLGLQFSTLHYLHEFEIWEILCDYIKKKKSQFLVSLENVEDLANRVSLLEWQQIARARQQPLPLVRNAFCCVLWLTTVPAIPYNFALGPAISYRSPASCPTGLRL